MEANDDRKPFGNSCCAHRTVEYRNNETNGRVSLEWWECRDCKSIFERKVESGGMSDDTIIRLQAMQLIALRSESPTLRDQFAMAALHAIDRPGRFFSDLASEAYRLADAMMEARKPK